MSVYGINNTKQLEKHAKSEFLGSRKWVSWFQKWVSRFWKWVSPFWRKWVSAKTHKKSLDNGHQILKEGSPCPNWIFFQWSPKFFLWLHNNPGFFFVRFGRNSFPPKWLNSFPKRWNSFPKQQNSFPRTQRVTFLAIFTDFCIIYIKHWHKMCRKVIILVKF